MIVIATDESGEKDFACIPLVKDQVPVHISVFNDIRCLRNKDLIINHTNPHRGNEVRVLYKNG